MIIETDAVDGYEEAIIAVQEPKSNVPHTDEPAPKRALTPTLEIQDWREESDQVGCFDI